VKSAHAGVLQCCFVNLPLRFIAREREYLDLFLDRGLQPELGIDAWALDHLPSEWHEEVSGVFRRAGLACAVHLPFFDLQPGSQDELILEASRKRLSQALRCARLYTPAHLIAHLGFDPLLYRLTMDSWQECSQQTWRGLLGDWPAHPPLYLENVHEADPRWIGSYLTDLAPEGVGLCLDIGHWHTFGRGARLGNLQEWLDLFGRVPIHLHLHDNHGEEDEHLGLGAGSIPLQTLLEEVNRSGARPGVTFEPHTREDLERTVEYVRTHARLFSFLTPR
jgi:sugar phosphate isomerase/epimerase